MSTESPVVLFHAACVDGYTSAWVARRKYPTATLVACHYGQNVLDEALLKGRDVILVDFSYPRPVMLQLAELARSVVVIDHHKSAQDSLSFLETTCSNVQVFFDLERSGAQLAWEHFFPANEPPELISYVADYDLWRFNLPNSQEINTAINSFEFSFDTWNELAMNSVLQQLVKQGKAIMRYQDRLVDSALKEGIEVTWHGYKTLVMNTQVKNESCNTALLLAAGYQVAMAWQQLKDGSFKYSVRTPKTGPDAAELAARYGGAGHPQSAGFSTNKLLTF